jgi:hypothetical protein
MYIANRLFETGGGKITEPQLQTMCIQAEARSVISSLQLTVEETKQKPAHLTVTWYEDQLQEVMETYRESVLHLLKQGQTMYLLSSYEKLRSEHFPIMMGIATLIQHLGGNKNFNQKSNKPYPSGGGGSIMTIFQCKANQDSPKKIR